MSNKNLKNTDEESIMQDAIDGVKSTEDDDNDILEADEDEVVRKSDERENAIEWYTGNDTLTVTLTQRKLINRVMKYAEEYPDEVKIVRENDDGILLAHVPLRYLSFRRPREVSEDQRQKMREQAYKNIADGKIGVKKQV